ncbi:hypothetical protein F5050DRAFT_1766952 [Lentinula boryana]|uniref:Uncharacterized protein n=1 Tax=Lentinula boryana TaxID=40481 RepID=A0ABQ8QAE3_9AGAR|nr:hypothetical protein F5050DRAFT_1766952 [Lentinula boryana]
MRFNLFLGMLAVASAVCAAPSLSRTSNDPGNAALQNLDSKDHQRSSTPSRRDETDSEAVINVRFDYNTDKEHTITVYDQLVAGIVQQVEGIVASTTKTSQVQLRNNPETKHLHGVSFFFRIGKKTYHAAAASAEDVYVVDALAPTNEPVLQKGKREWQRCSYLLLFSPRAPPEFISFAGIFCFVEMSTKLKEK